MKPALRWLAAEPLVQFLLIGGGLFLLHGAVRRSQPVGEIRVSEGQVASLAALHERAIMRPPSARELEGLVANWIREEVAVREARALGLDQNDAVIRRRLRQKLEFLAEERADRRQPSTAHLQAWLERHPNRYRRDSIYTFRQIHLDPNGRERPPLLLEPRFEALPGSDVERLFGREFTTSLSRLKPGDWVGPLASGYGAHLVRLERVEPGALPPLAEVREAVERDWRQDQRQRQRDADYRQLLARYRVVMPLSR